MIKLCLFSHFPSQAPKPPRFSPLLPEVLVLETPDPVDDLGEMPGIPPGTKEFYANRGKKWIYHGNYNSQEEDFTWMDFISVWEYR